MAYIDGFLSRAPDDQNEAFRAGYWRKGRKLYARHQG